MPIQPDGKAPYGPPQAVVDVIEGYRDRGLSTPFTTDVLAKAGVSDALVNRVLQTVRLLELVDEAGYPTEQFEALRLARGGDEYQARLQAWVLNVYSEILRFADPRTDPPERVAEAFRGFSPAGQRTRMVTLMLGLFRKAGLISEGVRSKPANRELQTRKPAPRQPVVRRSSSKQRQSSDAGLDELPPALVGLLRQLPSEWTREERASYLHAIEAVLNITVKVTEGRLALGPGLFGEHS